MSAIVKIDGIRLKLQMPDVDKDGNVGGVEHITQRINQNTTQINQPTELGESLKELNDDSIQPEFRMSGIDLRSNLHPIEISSILALDSLVALGVLPVKSLSFSRQKKRLAVSMNGRGRQDIVDIVSGKREHDKAVSPGFGERIKSFFSPGSG